MTDQSPLQSSSRDAYYARAATWATDHEKVRHKSSRLAWLIGGIAIGVAVFEAIALALLMPLKTVEPYTILVDRHTGYVQALEGTRVSQITANEALTQSLLAQYVTAREGFDIALVKANFRKIALWSGEPVRSRYLALMQPTNPASPLQQIPRTSVVNIQVKSISPIAPETALIRFDVERRDQGQAEGVRQSFVSIVRYRFSRAPMSLEDRLVNPLGFQVIHYRRDEETLLETTASAVARMDGTDRQLVASSAPSGRALP